MKIAGYALLGILALAGATAVVRLALVSIAVAVVIALIRQPRETMAVLCGLALLGAFNQHPLAGLLLLASAVWVGSPR